MLGARREAQVEAVGLVDAMNGEMRHDGKLGGRAAPVYTLRPVDDSAIERPGPGRLAAGFAALLLLSLGGDLIATMLGVAIPGPIIGLGIYLLLLAVSPRVGAWTLPAARLFTRLLGALIVPAAVGLFAFAPFLADVALPLVVVLVVSTLVTGVTTALLYAGLRR